MFAPPHKARRFKFRADLRECAALAASFGKPSGFFDDARSFRAPVGKGLRESFGLGLGWEAFAQGAHMPDFWR